MSGQIWVDDAYVALSLMGDESVNCIITSPPYFGLRSYLPDDHPDKHKEIGLEKDLNDYIDNLVSIFRESRRVLRKDGTLWLNLGDSYAKSGPSGLGLHGESSTTKKPNPYPDHVKSIPLGLKPKDLIGVPWRVALALQADGWWLRSDIIWDKPNAMPSSVRDRPTSSHEYVFLFSKSQKYYYDAESIKEDSLHPVKKTGSGSRAYKDRDVRNAKKQDRVDNRTYVGFNERWEQAIKDKVVLKRNKRDVWRIATRPFKEAHFATFPPALVEPMVKAACPEGGVVLDPFFGAGTVGIVAEALGRDWLGCELNEEYAEMAKVRILKEHPDAVLSIL